MGEDRDSGVVISEEQLDQLVDLFDRSEYALNPDSRDAKEAASDFNRLQDQLYQEVRMKLESVPYGQFKAFVRIHCQKIIATGKSKHTSLPPKA